MPGSSEQIELMLDITAQRDEIAFGLWRRYMLEPATKYDWLDPRKADGIPVLARRSVTPGSVNERLHVPYDREIVSNKVAYFASNIQLVFDEGLPSQVSEFYKMQEEKKGFNSRLLTQAKYSVDQGTSYMMCWVNTNGDFKVKPLKADEAHVEYDPMTGDPMYAYRYYIGANDETTFCEVYDGVEVTKWNRSKSLWTRGETRPHGLGTVARPAVPIIELRNNPEILGNPEMVISLCDAYDTSMSDLSSEIAQLRLSYLLIQGAGSDASGIKEQLQQAGIIVIDDANGSASFVDRNMNVSAVEQLQDELRMLIFEGSSSYDPTITASSAAKTAFEISQRYEAMDKDCIITIAEWQEGLGYYDYVVSNYLTMWEGVAEYDIEDIQRIFRKAIPRNMLQALLDARNAGLMLSTETLIELSGLPIDPVREMERINTTQTQFVPYSYETSGSVAASSNTDEEEPEEGPSQE